MGQVVNLNFHQTFKPERQYIASILELAGDNLSHSVKDISSLTGIPVGNSSGKVEPHILYANYMGLIDYEKKDGEYLLKRTALGETVYLEDPGLQEELTILVCHCMMQREKNGAPLWSKVFKTVLPMYKSGVKKEMLIKELNGVFEGNINTKNVAPFFGSYDSFFDLVGVLVDDGDSISINALPYNKEFIYGYAYVLFEYWDEQYGKQDEITSDQLEMLCFKEVFGWDTQQEYQVLEYLSDCGIVRMNRQLMPYTILKLVEKEDLIAKLYSELC